MENDKYTYSITQTGYVINSLSEEVRNKIPNNVIRFFDNNSDMSLLQKDMNDNTIKFDNFTNDTLKFLKVINYYINDNNNFKK